MENKVEIEVQFWHKIKYSKTLKVTEKQRNYLKMKLAHIIGF